MAWDYGHANGYHDVLVHLDDLIDAFKPCIAAFEKRIGPKPRTGMLAP